MKWVLGLRDPDLRHSSWLATPALSEHHGSRRVWQGSFLPSQCIRSWAHKYKLRVRQDTKHQEHDPLTYLKHLCIVYLHWPQQIYLYISSKLSKGKGPCKQSHKHKCIPYKHPTCVNPFRLMITIYLPINPCFPTACQMEYPERSYLACTALSRRKRTSSLSCLTCNCLLTSQPHPDWSRSLQQLESFLFSLVLEQSFSALFLCEISTTLPHVSYIS